jgi:hypothetical protein
VLRDAIDRDWRCCTPQVDLNLPGRLGSKDQSALTLGEAVKALADEAVAPDVARQRKKRAASDAQLKTGVPVDDGLNNWV